jgi:beta-glucosidase
LTFYASLDGLPEFTDYSFRNRTYRYFSGKPLWGFGFGLSYSKFKYGPLKLSTSTLKAGEPINATVSVTNTGAIAGDEVVEAYLKTPQQGGPMHTLVGFERVSIPAGATKEVMLRIDPRSLSSVDDQGNRSILAGRYVITLGGAQPQETEAKSEAGFAVSGTASLPK